MLSRKKPPAAAEVNHQSAEGGQTGGKCGSRKERPSVDGCPATMATVDFKNKAIEKAKIATELDKEAEAMTDSDAQVCVPATPHAVQAERVKRPVHAPCRRLAPRRVELPVRCGTCAHGGVLCVTGRVLSAFDSGRNCGNTGPRILAHSACKSISALPAAAGTWLPLKEGGRGITAPHRGHHCLRKKANITAPQRCARQWRPHPPRPAARR